MSDVQGARQRLPALDLARFGAAMMVMLYHLGYHEPERRLTAQVNHPGFTIPLAHSVLPLGFGWVGVQIFFVISGFVIAYSAERETAFTFLQRRILRLAPSLWCCSLITAGVLAIAGVPLVMLAQLLLKSWVLWPFGPWVDQVYWTLTIEVAFYACIFLLLLIKSFRRLELIAGIVAIASTACNLVVALQAAPGVTLSNFPFLHHAVHFALGIFIWLTLFKGWTPWRVAAIAVCLAGGCAEIIAVGRTFSHTSGAPIVWLIGVALIGAAGLYRTGEYGERRRVASLLSLAGLTTYPLYLIHDNVGRVLLAALYQEGAADWWALLVASAGMLALSVAIVLLVEPSIRKVLRAAFGVSGKVASRFVR